MASPPFKGERLCLLIRPLPQSAAIAGGGRPMDANLPGEHTKAPLSLVSDERIQPQRLQGSKGRASEREFHDNRGHSQNVL